MTDAASAIMNLLNTEWSLSSPAKADIYWANSRFEAVDFARVGKNYVVACYAPMAVASVKSVAAGLWQIEQNVMVDIIVRVTSSVDAAVEARESMRGEVYRIIKAKETSSNIFALIQLTREFNKVESPDLVRVSLQVSCLTFQT